MQFPIGGFPTAPPTVPVSTLRPSPAPTEDRADTASQASRSTTGRRRYRATVEEVEDEDAGLGSAFGSMHMYVSYDNCCQWLSANMLPPRSDRESFGPGTSTTSTAVPSQPHGATPRPAPTASAPAAAPSPGLAAGASTETRYVYLGHGTGPARCTEGRLRDRYPNEGTPPVPPRATNGRAEMYYVVTVGFCSGVFNDW